jgi:hypothetical protein
MCAAFDISKLSSLTSLQIFVEESNWAETILVDDLPFNGKLTDICLSVPFNDSIATLAKYQPNLKYISYYGAKPSPVSPSLIPTLKSLFLDLESIYYSIEDEKLLAPLLMNRLIPSLKIAESFPLSKPCLDIIKVSMYLKVIDFEGHVISAQDTAHILLLNSKCCSFMAKSIEVNDQLIEILKVHPSLSRIGFVSKEDYGTLSKQCLNVKAITRLQ